MKIFTALVILVLLAYIVHWSKTRDQKMFTRAEVKQEIVVGTPEITVLEKLGEPSNRAGNQWVYYKRMKKREGSGSSSFSVFFENNKVTSLILDY